MVLQQTRSNILKLALFCTGLSGIVAEYILSTLATYFLGDSVFQWTMILSVMLFSMGVGSRLSKSLENNLLEKFILIEFLLSVLVSFSALATYMAAALTDYLGLIIYTLSVSIGVLIGMEIPIVTRLNDQFESLRVNIAAVMEKDYYGSLLGGVFFAFVGLPYLGLTYTPFVLGGVNFAVALILFVMLRSMIERQKVVLVSTSVLVTGLLIAGVIYAEPIVLFGEQKSYKDKVIFTEQSRYQKIVVTEWKNNYWLYINGNPQLSSFDEWLYHEPLVHPVMGLSKKPSHVLVLGGGDGCAVREVLKYASVDSVTLVDLDPVMTGLSKNHPVFTTMNQNALNNPKVQVINQDAFTYLKETNSYFDVIISDFPDPKSIELGRLFSVEFFTLCQHQLRPEGVMVVQSGSPYYASKAFLCIEKSLQAAGFQTLPTHNQVLTMGEWGWVIGAKNMSREEIKARIQHNNLEGIPTQWLNQEAMLLITSFGKDLIKFDSASVEANTIQNPVLPRYYNNGNWDLY